MRAISVSYSAFRAGLIVALLIMVAAFPAHAIDRETLLTRLDAWFAENGMNVEFGEVEETGSGNFAIGHIDIQNKRSPEPGRMENVAITGASVGDDGSFFIEKIAFATLRHSFETPDGRAMQLTIDGGEATGLFSPDIENPQAKLISGKPSEWRTGAIRVSAGGVAPAIAIEGMTGRIEPGPDGLSARSSGAIAQILVNPDELADKEISARAAELGLQEIKLAVRYDGSWDAASGRAELQLFRIDAASIGSLELAVALDGYTIERARAMRLANAETRAMAGKNTLDGLKAMQGVMATLGEIKLASARLSFRDGSITHRLLDMQAKESGATREEMIELTPSMALGFMQVLGNPEFARSTQAALKAFLAQPGSFTLRFDPPAPVPVTGIVGMALMSPETIVGSLGASVKAD